MKLRSYQTEAIDAVQKHWADGSQRAGVVLPTGVGKTVIFSALARQLEVDRRRVVILTHREELVNQTVAKLRAMGCQSVGIVKAGRDDTWARVVVATVQTLYSDRRLARLGEVDVVIADELHHFAAARNRTLLSRLGVFDGRALAAGFTATFVRSDSAKLGVDWDVVYERDVQWAIEHGYLADVEAHSIRVPDLDMTTVRSSGGDYADKSLGDAVSASSADTVIPAAWRRYADGRPTILFAPTIASCGELADGMRADGIPTDVVFGTTASADRAAIYDRIRNGQTSVLASVGVLTEGFDIPAISCAILARPTKSRGLWQQMAGRALRLFPGKDKAILLDITGDAENHSLASVTDLSRASAEAETKPRAVSLCACSEALVVCCTPGETRLECRKRKAEGNCTCRCVCDVMADDDGLTLVRGDHDIEVDLFAGSTSVWLRTIGGVWFVPTQECTWFIAQRPDAAPGYYVGRTGDNRRMDGGAWASPEPLDQSAAMMVCQELAMETDPTVASRDAKWRRNRPSAGQAQMAVSMGLASPEEIAAMRRGPVSDLISIWFASKLLDSRIGSFTTP